MRKLTVFNLMTLDGYIAGPGGEISWHNVDGEFQELAIAASNSGNTLLFGRITYELMAVMFTVQGTETRFHLKHYRLAP